MARLFQSGGEIDPVALAAATVTTTGDPDGSAPLSGVVTRDTSVFRSGLSSWKCTTTGTGLATMRSAQTFVDGNSYFLRGYFNISAAPATASPILGLGVSLTSGIYARLRTDGALELFVNSAAQGSPSAAITGGSWHRVELKGTATATTTWTVAELLLDGVSVATWSGSVSRGTNTGWGPGLRGDSAGTGYVVNVDDVALNDSTGATNNTYPGDGKVVLLSPVSDNAAGTGWTLGTGTATGGNAHTAVANTSPLGVADLAAGSDVKQIRNASSNANVNYDANMTTYTAAGIGASDTINAVIPWVLTSAPVATAAKLGTVGVVSNPAITNVNLGATGTSGAFWGGITAGTYGTGWKWSPGTVTEQPSVTLGTAPVMRITQVTASTRIAMVCGMFMYVDYTPAAAVATSLLPQSTPLQARALYRM